MCEKDPTPYDRLATRPAHLILRQLRAEQGRPLVEHVPPTVEDLIELFDAIENDAPYREPGARS